MEFSLSQQNPETEATMLAVCLYHIAYFGDFKPHCLQHRYLHIGSSFYGLFDFSSLKDPMTSHPHTSPQAVLVLYCKYYP